MFNIPCERIRIRSRLTFSAKHIFFAALVVSGPILSTLSVFAQNSKGDWLTGPRADALWSDMAHGPYAQAGNHGMIVYMISYSSCVNCVAFLRDFWDSRRANMQLREIFAPINQPRYLDEAADIALTRNAETVEAYYKRLRVAPPVNSSPAREAALQRLESFTTQINDFFRQIGHIQDGFPTFVFRVKDASGQDKVMIVSGWGDSELTRDMDTWVKEAAR